MRLRSSVFLAASLDGFIAGPNGELDWLDAANAAVPAGADLGFAALLASVDGLVMGRKTFEQVLAFGVWPYNSKPVIVLSRNRITIPAHLAETVSHSSESPGALCARLSAQGATRLYVDGGVTVGRFLAAGLIDDITITVIPVILGCGIPMFGGVAQDIPLRHITTKTYNFGFVQLTYEVVREEKDDE